MIEQAGLADVRPPCNRQPQRTIFYVFCFFGWHCAIAFFGERLQRFHKLLDTEVVFCRKCQGLAEAEPLYREAETIYRQLGAPNTLDLANTLRGLALVKESTGNIDQSKKLWNEARKLYAERNVEAGVSECDKKLSQLTK